MSFASSSYTSHHPGSTPGTFVHLISNQEDENIITGRRKPYLVTSEEPQSISLVIDGKTRSSNMNPFDFRVSMNSNLYRSRMARVSRVVIPKPPNVTVFNNQLSFTQFDGVSTSSFSISLQPAFYNTTTFSNELAARLTEAAGGDNVYVVVYDSVTRTFRVTYTNLGISRLFFFHSESSFIVRGDFFAPFPSFPSASDVLTVGTGSLSSGAAGMLYTRYAIISSESFNQFSFSDSRATTLLLRGNIICIVDMTSIYTPEDYDIGIPFSGIFASVETAEAPHIMVANSQRNMDHTIDIYVQDEYGEPFNDVMYLGSSYPANSLGVSLWMEVTF